MHPAVHDDRIWFRNNPSAVVRFRKIISGEFQALEDHGSKAPVFLPSFCRAETPTRWVAVLDLMRLIEPEAVEPNEPTVRLRLKVPALRSIHRRRRAEQELKKAVASELLADLETNTDAIAA